MKREELKLLFVNCCLRRGAPTKVLPVGLAYIMTYAHERGYTNLDLLDLDINDYDEAYVEDYLNNHQYDVIMLGSIVTHYKWVKWFVKTAKRIHPNTKIIVGNSVAGSIFKVFMANAPVDVVVIGEGEVSAFETLEAIREGRPFDEKIEGIAFRGADGALVQTTKRKALDVNTLSMINWDFFDLPRYFAKSAHSYTFGVEQKDVPVTKPIPVSTARGCAFRCTFCHFVFWDDPYRHRAPENVVAEIRRNIEKYGINFINFWDDLSFASLPQVEKMCDAILASGLQFRWMAAIRCDLFGRDRMPLEKRIEIAQKMKASGCTAVGFSLESGNPEILKMMNKKIEPEFFFDTVQILRKVGIVCNASIVFGYPIETPETIKQTFDMCLKARVYPSMGFLLPLPYTGMYDYAKEHGFIKDEDKYLESITERQDICLNMTTMSDEQIMNEIKTGAQRLNEALDLKLSQDKLVRTGGYKKHTDIDSFKKKPPVDPENMKRNENDFSFNYSEAVFEVDAGVGADEAEKAAKRKKDSDVEFESC